MDKVLLWRVVYAPRVTLQSDAFCAGPWHPSRAHVEQCAAVLATRLPVGLQSNRQAVDGSCVWPVPPPG